MRRLPGHLITTVPLIASQIFFRADMSATAGEFTPLATVELLSKSHAADTRCKFLDPAGHDELGRYVVHVESAAAEIEGRAAARAAFAQGLQAGKSAECSTQIEAETVSTLKAARRAMAAMRGDRALAESAAVATEGRNSPQSILSAAGDLAVHEQRMAAYFTELHCDHLAYRQRWNFWRVIVAQHQAAVGQFGPEASDAKERAQTLSESRKCSKETAALVQAQYREIVRK